jgi:serine/threonine protein phosphatase PrpC
MRMRNISVGTASYRSHSEDRLLVLNTGNAWILGLSDGTGGISGGASAAEYFVQGIHRASLQSTFDVSSPNMWSALLTEIDDEIRRIPHAGETTGIALAVTTGMITGASCGDSEAWLLTRDSRLELTGNQVRKPRLGSGRAEPRSFHAVASGILLVASDGLFGHVTLNDVARALLPDPGRAVAALTRLLEEQHRRLPDDVAMIIAQLDNTE